MNHEASEVVRRHLLVGFDRLRKRPRAGSLRFKAIAGLGAAGAVFATAAWQGYEEFVRPSGGTGGDGGA